MRRSTMIAGGAVLGIAGVIALPRPSTPQQVAVAGNAAATASGERSRLDRRRRRDDHEHRREQRIGSGRVGQAGGQDRHRQPRHRSVRPAAGEAQRQERRITKVGFTTFVANDGHSVQIDQSAAPVLIRETIAAQSAHIQGVSGATYTSNAYQQSLQAAIDKAGLKA